VLERVDRVVAWLSWLAAAALVLMLLIGPQVIAKDERKPTSEASGAAPYASDSGGGGQGGEAPDGKALFTDSCGSCHALEAAGTSGQVGPALDGTSLSAADVEAIVRDGRGGMPAFDNELSDEEISAVSTFVAGAP
jgi:mono/diheme cytochrome c family protein